MLNDQTLESLILLYNFIKLYNNGFVLLEYFLFDL